MIADRPQEPLFSVLLPTHDSPATLPVAISSVLEQSNENFELLVVGDGCTGPEADIVASFDDPRIRWFDLPKAPGFGYTNRNIALREARGQLIAIASDDDIMLPAHLAELARPFAQPQVQWAHCRPMWVSGEGLIMPVYANLRQHQARRLFQSELNFIPSGSIAHRRKCLEEVGYWPENGEGGGDWALWKTIIGHYGPACIGFTRQPTHLHFRAVWRTDVGDWWPRFLAQLRAQALAWPGHWYSALRIEPTEGRSFQQQLWHEIETDPNRARGIGFAVHSLQDQLAWQATQPQIFR